MYSRKYIRSPAAISSQMERTSPSTGGTPLPIASRSEERGVTLPPDYTGMAFSRSGKSSSLQNPGDYPETLIPPIAEEIPHEGDTDPALLFTGEDEPEELVPPSPLLSESAMPSAEEGTRLLKEEQNLPLTQAEEPPALPLDTAEEESAPVAEPDAGHQAVPPAPSMPILTPELLRSLTLEDLLLFWMLLMLTVSSQEDQIYLLLGLLLFQR